MKLIQVIIVVVTCSLLSWSRVSCGDVIVSPIWLYDRLSIVHVLEASWKLTEDQANMQLIPGTLLWDLRQCTMPTSTRPHNDPEELCIQIYARRLGIDMEKPIVIYDRTNMYEAARAWWTLSMLYGREDVAVLDGGWKEWTRQELPTIVGHYQQFRYEDDLHRGNWVARYNVDHVRDLAQMTTDIRTAQRQVIDTRLSENFRGEKHEPSHFTIQTLVAAKKLLCRRMLHGHMLSAINVPWLSVVDRKSWRLLDCHQINEVFQTAGVDLQRPLTTTCYIGDYACLVALAAVQCGARDVAVYSGSWTEWAQLADDRLVVRSSANDKVFLELRCPETRSSPKAAFMDIVFPVRRNNALNCDDYQYD